MKFLFINMLLCFNFLHAESKSAAKEPRAMLESISEYAIHIGTGKSKTVYLFVDPLCKFSKEIVTKISENKMLQLTDSYYVFLYRLPKLDSEKLIQYIYQSDDQKSALLDIMVEGEIVDFDNFKADDKTLNTIGKIAKVAKKLDMKLRPYMISFEKDSQYCRVSEGSASCLEELAAFE